MRRVISFSVALLVLLFGARSTPMQGEHDEGSSSSFPSSESTGFDWQEHQYPQAWSPDPVQQLWSAETPREDSLGHERAAGGATSELSRTVSALTSSMSRPKSIIAFAQPARDLKAGVREALGRPHLQFTSLAPSSPVYGSRFFVAHDPSIPEDRLVFDPTQLPPSNRRKTWHHFGDLLKDVVKVDKQDLQHAMAVKSERRMIYLNSRANMDDINRLYFLNKMHFLPINEAKLSWDVANKLFLDRKKLVLLPPLESNRLGVLLASHPRANSETMAEIRKLTGPALQDATQIVSLWGPLLTDGERGMAVLYGIGQLDSREVDGTVRHLHTLKSQFKVDQNPVLEAIHYLHL
ncbi:hypothetical protein EX895_004993 [Sporisorium graminicola]|uniref:Uncharacterized protein n=1 Tax=Sporisorium graminicola TaxID=280036 RepID=A0A4U7KSD5_9BASI|nr:hypothetical protein EX895_004993 [Sporisorium graminicola]TKY86168.1 hypothetical protein EX895_004993 [Sporisorium graminicola]